VFHPPDRQCSHLGPLALFCTAYTLLIASCLFWSENWLLAYFLPPPSPIVSIAAKRFFVTQHKPSCILGDIDSGVGVQVDTNGVEADGSDETCNAAGEAVVEGFVVGGSTDADDVNACDNANYVPMPILEFELTAQSALLSRGNSPSGSVCEDDRHSNGVGNHCVDGGDDSGGQSPKTSNDCNSNGGVGGLKDSDGLNDDRSFSGMCNGERVSDYDRGTGGLCQGGQGRR